MGCPEYVDVEIAGLSEVKDRNAERPKPFAVRNVRLRAGDQVACRVAEILDFELAQGSMPT